MSFVDGRGRAFAAPAVVDVGLGAGRVDVLWPFILDGSLTTERRRVLFLLLGLIGFLGLHSLRVFAPGWREARMASLGEGAWKGLYSLLSVIFFALLLWGYGQARQDPQLIWLPPSGVRGVSALLMLAVFVLLAAAYVPRNHLKRSLGHPMLVAVVVWAVAHLLTTGWLHSMVLFAGFALWAGLVLHAARRRPPVTAAGPTLAGTAVTMAVGVAAWVGFAMFLHLRLIGVAPF